MLNRNSKNPQHRGDISIKTTQATPKVADDICATFNIEKGGLFRTSTYRSK